MTQITTAEKQPLEVAHILQKHIGDYRGNFKSLR